MMFQMKFKAPQRLSKTACFGIITAWVFGLQNGAPAAKKTDIKSMQKAWVISQKHEIYGPQKIFLNPNWMMTENEREGTSYIKHLDKKNLVMFNRKKRVFYQGTSHSVMKRMTFISHLANANLTSPKNKDRKNWKLSKTTNFMGLKTKIYSLYQGKKYWKIWVADMPGIKPSVYKDYIDWSKVPNLGGMPLRLVHYSRAGKNTVILDTGNVAKTKVSPRRLEIPRGSKEVKEIFQVSSGRTEQLMESFSEILGD